MTVNELSPTAPGELIVNDVGAPGEGDGTRDVDPKDPVSPVRERAMDGVVPVEPGARVTVTV